MSADGSKDVTTENAKTSTRSVHLKELTFSFQERKQNAHSNMEKKVQLKPNKKNVALTRNNVENALTIKLDANQLITNVNLLDQKFQLHLFFNARYKTLKRTFNVKNVADSKRLVKEKDVTKENFTANLLEKFQRFQEQNLAKWFILMQMERDVIVTFQKNQQIL
jgi:hypothetical protein